MRKFLVVSSLVVVVLAGIIVALPHFVSVNQFKPKIVSLVEAHTHRRVSLDGDIQLSLFPSLALTVNDIHLLQNDNQTDLVHIGNLSLMVELWPLLKGQVSVESLALNEVKASLEISKQGVPNWQPVAQAHKETATKASESDGVNATESQAVSAEDASSDGTLVLNEILVTKAMIDFKDLADQRHITLDNVSLSADLKNQQSQIDFSGIITQLDKKHQAFSLKGLFNVPSSTSLTTKDAKLTLGQIKATVNLEVDLARKVKLIEAGIYLNDADVTPYADWWNKMGKKHAESSGKSAEIKAASSGAKSSKPWSSETIDLSVLREYEGHLGLYFDGLTFGNLRLGKGDIYNHLQFGVLSSKIKQLRLLDGDAQGELKLSAPPSGTVMLESQLTLSDISLSELPEEIKKKAFEPSGKVAFSLKVNGQGSSQKSLVNSLSGTAKLGVKQAEFLTLADKLQSALQDPLLSAAIAPYRQSFGDIESLDATWSIAKGVLKNDDFRMQSSPVSFIGEGEVNLPDYQLYYRFKPVRTGDGKQVNFAGVKLPDVVVKGGLDDPKFKLDAGDTVRALIEKGLSDGGVKDIKRELIENRREIVDELKKGLGKDGLKNLLNGL